MLGGDEDARDANELQPRALHRPARQVPVEQPHRAVEHAAVEATLLEVVHDSDEPVDEDGTHGGVDVALPSHVVGGRGILEHHVLEWRLRQPAQVADVQQAVGGHGRAIQLPVRQVRRQVWLPRFELLGEAQGEGGAPQRVEAERREGLAPRLTHARHEHEEWLGEKRPDVLHVCGVRRGLRLRGEGDVDDRVVREAPLARRAAGCALLGPHRPHEQPLVAQHKCF
mmetsp:Transcript_46841/g.123444  ORF Transcript_46841/g.123444 Transcript_46841/m.123444 type:complete len:226 (-) Transcript_46841:28-705(-)